MKAPSASPNEAAVDLLYNTLCSSNEACFSVLSRQYTDDCRKEVFALNDKEKNHVERSSSDFTSAEKKLIGILREVKFGKVEIVIQDGVPVRVDEIRKSIKI